VLLAELAILVGIVWLIVTCFGTLDIKELKLPEWLQGFNALVALCLGLVLCVLTVVWLAQLGGYRPDSFFGSLTESAGK
jgi:uncharacterized protein involved in cysteine biosynthesis